MIIKLCGIEFTKEELEQAYFEDDRKFIIKFNTIYQLLYSKNYGFHVLEVYADHNKTKIGFVKRGRFILSKANLVNELIGKELFFD